MFWTFLGPPNSLMIYSTINHQKLPFSDPTHPPLWWRNTWMAPNQTFYVWYSKFGTLIKFFKWIFQDNIKNHGVRKVLLQKYVCSSFKTIIVSQEVSFWLQVFYTCGLWCINLVASFKVRWTLSFSKNFCNYILYCFDNYVLMNTSYLYGLIFWNFLRLFI